MKILLAYFSAGAFAGLFFNIDDHLFWTTFLIIGTAGSLVEFWVDKRESKPTE